MRKPAEERYSNSAKSNIKDVTSFKSFLMTASNSGAVAVFNSPTSLIVNYLSFNCLMIFIFQILAPFSLFWTKNKNNM